MASTVTVSTRPVTRNKLAQFLNNQELIKLFENLAQDVSTAIPEALDSVSQDSLDQATAAQALASLAQSVATIALALASQATEGPPVPVVTFPETPDDLTAQLSVLRERVTVLERRVSDLEERPSP